MAVAEYCPKATVIRSDFKGLVGLEAQPPRVHLQASSFYAGIKLRVRGGPAWNPQKKIVKVKAHQDLEGLKGSDEWAHSRGKHEADRFAKVGAGTISQPSELENIGYQSCLTLSKRSCVV